MPKNVLLPPLTLEQRRAKKINDWKVRRVMRVLQVRQQSRVLSEDQRLEFWDCVDKMEKERINDIECELQIEENLMSKKQAEEQCKYEEARSVAFEQDRQHQQRLAEKKLTPEEYAERARQRFEKAMAEERNLKQQKKDTDSIALLKRTRQEEDAKSRIRAAHFRQSQLPITIDVPAEDVHRDSMVPREGVPIPTTYSPNNSTMVSPISTSRGSLIPREMPEVSLKEAARGRYSPSSPASRPRKQPPEVVVKPRKLVFPTPAARFGEKRTQQVYRPSVPSDGVDSIISLDQENMQVVSTPEESLVARPVMPAKPRAQVDVAVSVQSSLNVSSRDSILSEDSVSLRSNLRLRARELSPPKQFPGPFVKPSSSKIRPGQPLPDVISGRRICSPERKPSRETTDSALPKWNEMAPYLLQELAAFGLNVTPETTESADWSISTGPLSTADLGFIGSNESWLSYQSLSQNSSFRDSLSVAESGTIFSSNVSHGMTRWSLSVGNTSNHTNVREATYSSGVSHLILGLSSSMEISSSVSSGNLEGMVSDHSVKSVDNSR